MTKLLIDLGSDFVFLVMNAYMCVASIKEGRMGWAVATGACVIVIALIAYSRIKEWLAQ